MNNELPRADAARPRTPPLWPADDAFEAEPSINALSADEQLARFLLWLKVHDAGHQPC